MSIPYAAPGVVRDVASLREAIAACLATTSSSGGGTAVGHVHTAGRPHAGHLALIARSHAENQITVVSRFVAPSPVNAESTANGLADSVAARGGSARSEGGLEEPETTDEAHDADRLARAGGRIVFAPSVPVMLPEGYSTIVSVNGLSDALEGARQPGHVRALTTLHTRLLQMVRPTRTYVGEKDWQQFLLLQRVAQDLLLHVDIVMVPTARESDGLAIANRNTRLSPDARQSARTIWAALEQTQALFAGGVRDVAVLESRLRTRLLDDPALDVEYAVVSDATTLAPVTQLYAPARAFVAAEVGGVRLIDNVALG